MIYDEILSGQPGAWIVKRIFLICMQYKSAEKELILKFQNNSRTGFVFMIYFTVHELWPVYIFSVMTATEENMINLEKGQTVFKFLISSNASRIYFCEFYPLNVAQNFQFENSTS